MKDSAEACVPACPESGDGARGEGTHSRRRKNKAAKAVFDKLSYSHRREYVHWVEEAKKPETRARRIDKTIEMLMALKKEAKKIPGESGDSPRRTRMMAAPRALFPQQPSVSHEPFPHLVQLEGGDGRAGIR